MDELRDGCHSASPWHWRRLEASAKAQRRTLDDVVGTDRYNGERDDVDREGRERGRRLAIEKELLPEIDAVAQDADVFRCRCVEDSTDASARFANAIVDQ